MIIEHTRSKWPEIFKVCNCKVSSRTVSFQNWRQSSGFARQKSKVGKVVKYFIALLGWCIWHSFEIGDINAFKGIETKKYQGEKTNKQMFYI